MQFIDYKVLMADSTSKGHLEELCEKQSIRAELRYRYLWWLKDSRGNCCQIDLYNDTQLHGTYLSSDIHGTEFVVENLQTPTEIYPAAIIRKGDIVALTVQKTAMKTSAGETTS